MDYVLHACFLANHTVAVVGVGTGFCDCPHFIEKEDRLSGRLLGPWSLSYKAWGMDLNPGQLTLANRLFI